MSLLPKAPPPRRRTLSAAWRGLWETEPPVYPVRLGAGDPWPKTRRFTPAFLTSFLIQSALIFFYYNIPFALILAWFMGPPPGVVPPPPPLVVVKLNHLNLADYLPIIKPRGEGKAPGRGLKPHASPRLGASHFDPRITIISNPPHPDNQLLTLKNEMKPPDPRPPKELKIPDLISGGPAPTPEAGKSAPPAPEKVDIPTPEKPVPVTTPKLPPVPVVPVIPEVQAAPPPPPPELNLTSTLPDLPAPHLEVPPPPPPVKAPEKSPTPTPPGPTSARSESASKQVATPTPGSSPSSPNNKSGGTGIGDTEKPGGGPQIVSLSVNQVPLTDLSSIPGGRHAGAFSISPAGKVGGSPGGVPGGSPEGGEGGPGPGGDRSLAVGKGKGVPGGGGSGGPASNPSAELGLSISGPSGGTGITAGTLPPLKPEDLVYPVKPDTPKAKAPTMVVSTGAFGGGGLRIFGVLHSDKIYSVYFSMPGRSWILQYCVHDHTAQPDPTTRIVQFHMQAALVPPAPIVQSDFHRPMSDNPGSVGYVLHGIIHDDGSVGDLKVLEGGDPVSNAAAIIAFSRWKFRPATRGGVPVELEVLVGIP